MKVEWVAQEDDNGCAIAAMAMVVGQSYQQTKAELPAHDEHGISHFQTDHYLADKGFAVATKYPTQQYAHKEREVWPVEPFADLHICWVIVNETSRRSHVVVMLVDGTVLDPLTPEPKRLTDYYYIHNIQGVVRLK